MKDHDCEPHISFSRSPDPCGSNWKGEVVKMEQLLARVHQVHVCKPSTCLQRNSHGKMICKRQALWPLVEKMVVHAMGVLDLQQTYSFLNGYSPAILLCLWCNNNVKMVIFGKETKSIGGYLTNYQMKDPSKTYNMSMLLGSALMHHQQHLSRFESVWEQNCLLIFQCFNV